MYAAPVAAGGVPANPGAPTLAPNNANAQSEGNPAHLARYPIPRALFDIAGFLFDVAAKHAPTTTNTLCMDALHYHISRLNVRVATVHSPPPAGKHGLDGGQIAGIIIGVLLALAAVAAAGLLLMRRQKRRCALLTSAIQMGCKPRPNPHSACVQALKCMAPVSC